MKLNRYFVFLLFLLLGALMSCSEVGDSKLELSEDTAPGKLPEELKGLKVYSICVGNEQFIRVALLDGKINSITDLSGKTKRHTIMLTKVEAVDNYSIPIKEIISETDSIIVARK